MPTKQKGVVVGLYRKLMGNCKTKGVSSWHL